MKKVLILSYFYPPSSFVGGERTQYWAENIAKHGYYPIIITRCWNKEQDDLTNELNDNSLKIENHKNYEVHRLPFKTTLRDRLAQKGKAPSIQAFLSFLMAILGNIHITFLPYGNFKNYTDKLIQIDSSIKLVLASGRPFQLFQIAYKLNRKHNIPWVADYRDEWTTNFPYAKNVNLWKIIHKIESFCESKWVKTAAFCTVTTEPFISKINAKTGRPCHLIRNGIVLEQKQIPNKKKNTHLNILYLGTLYHYQQIELIFEALNDVQSKEIKFTFLGIENIPAQLERVKRILNNCSVEYEILPKIPKKQLQKFCEQFDIGLMMNYSIIDGIIPVKAYEYFSNGLVSMLYPNDKDAIEKFLTETNSGIAFNTKEECKKFLLDSLEKKQKGQPIWPEFNYEAAKVYSREYQTEKLAKLMDELLEAEKQD